MLIDSLILNVIYRLLLILNHVFKHSSLIILPLLRVYSMRLTAQVEVIVILYLLLLEYRVVVLNESRLDLLFL